MVGAKKQIFKTETLWSVLFALILLAFYYFYLFFRIDPKLIYQAQEPVFFMDKYFVQGFLNLPGGINELFAGFLGQFLYFSWSGALLLVILLGLITWNTNALLRTIDDRQPILYLHWVPSVILLALHSNYKFPLLITTGLFQALFFTNVYMRLVSGKIVFRILWFAALLILLYYLAAGFAMIFAGIVILLETLKHNRIVLPIIYAAFTGLVPWLGASFFFLIYIRDAYILHLSSYKLYAGSSLLPVLYGFFPVSLIIVAIIKKTGLAAKMASVKPLGQLFNRSTIARLVYGSLLLILLIAVAFLTYDKTEKTCLKIQYHARLEEWPQVLELIEQNDLNPNRVQYMANRALYHLGALCDKMFRFTQQTGVHGLFLSGNYVNLFLSQHSDLFFDLGLINEAEHWTYEDISVTGETAWNIRRLVLVNLLKKDPVVAEKYLKKLAKTFWHRPWAEEYLKLIAEKKEYSIPPQLENWASRMPANDFLVPPNAPELCLEKLMQNPANKMAFEYFMAYCMLEGKISDLAKNVHRMAQFDYAYIPRHPEEALLIYIQLTGNDAVGLPGRRIRPETIRRFLDFNKILNQHGKNKLLAHSELEKNYRDTYWYYALYYFKPRG